MGVALPAWVGWAVQRLDLAEVPSQWRIPRSPESVEDKDRLARSRSLPRIAQKQAAEAAAEAPPHPRRVWGAVPFMPQAEGVRVGITTRFRLSSLARQGELPIVMWAEVGAQLGHQAPHLRLAVQAPLAIRRRVGLVEAEAGRP